MHPSYGGQLQDGIWQDVKIDSRNLNIIGSIMSHFYYHGLRNIVMPHINGQGQAIELMQPHALTFQTK